MRTRASLKSIPAGSLLTVRAVPPQLSNSSSSATSAESRPKNSALRSVASSLSATSLADMPVLSSPQFSPSQALPSAQFWQQASAEAPIAAWLTENNLGTPQPSATEQAPVSPADRNAK